MYHKNLSLENIVYQDSFGNEQIEIWADIENYNDVYQVSNLGRIKSLYRIVYRSGKGTLPVKEKIRRQTLNTGYLKIKLVNKTFLVHRLVAVAFIPNPENKLEVNHKKGITTDSRYFEIEWSNRSENCQHAYDTGLNPRKTGVRNAKSKLNDSIVLAIRRLHSYNNNVSLPGIAKKLNVGYEAVSRIVKRKTWTHI